MGGLLITHQSTVAKQHVSGGWTGSRLSVVVRGINSRTFGTALHCAVHN